MKDTKQNINLTNRNIHAVTGTIAPAHFSTDAQKEIALLFSQLNAYFAKSAKKYVDPVSKAIYSATPPVVVEFNGEAVPVCAVKHSAHGNGTSDIVFYEYSPKGRHIGTLFIENDEVFVVNSQDPRTIDFSDIKPHEIRDFVGSLAIELEDRKWVNRFRASTKHLNESFRNSDKVEKDSTPDTVPVEIAPESKRGHRIKNAMKKFAFKHIMVSETVALALGLSAQSCIGMISNYVVQDPIVFQLDPVSQISLTQEFSPISSVLAEAQEMKLEEIGVEQQINAAEYVRNEGTSFEHAYVLDSSSLGKTNIINIPASGNCVSVIANDIDVSSKIYAAAPKGLMSLEIRVLAPDLDDHRTSGLVEVCNARSSTLKKSANGEKFALQISSVDELETQGLALDVRTIELAISNR